ncbi:MAG: Mov34/MPN/PAD-1 family protein [Candidatus Limnocylindrales bacterium]
MVTELAHPGPATTELPEAIRSRIIEHARRDDPNEACGLIIGSAPAAAGGRALRFVATRNTAASPYRYEIDSGELLAATIEADTNGEEIWGIVHSHTHTAAQPSPTDVGLAYYPDALYVLVSLAESEADPRDGAPGIRAWRIVAGDVFEVGLSWSAPE